MQLQATKTFTKWLNNNISHFDGVERFDLLKLTEEQYTCYVDCRGVYEPYEYGDYDDSDGTIKYIDDNGDYGDYVPKERLFQEMPLPLA